ncbi:MAG: type II secretion system protein GspN [Spirochaetes bacterium]|nr:type II secretion system protein GspN [Spirochaetota bacterium]MBN2770646.1 type II secretion system protein GspN [Spirochaetota bacterium]
MDKIKVILKKIKTAVVSFIKSAATQTGFKRFCFLTIILTVIFTVATFPYDKVILKYIKGMEGNKLQSISLPGFKFSLPGKISSNSIAITLKTGSVIQAKSSYANTNLFSIMLFKDLKTDFSFSNMTFESNGKSYGGSLSGTTDLELNSQNYMPANGNIRLSLKNLTLSGLKITGFDIPDIKINQLLSEIEFKDLTATFSKTAFNGEDLNGSISGTITLDDKNTNNSRINLIIDIRQDSGLIDKFRMLIASYINPATNTIRISVGGTFSRPDIKFNR